MQQLTVLSHSFLKKGNLLVFIHTYEQTFKLKFSDNSLTKLYYLIGLSLSSFKRRTKGQIDFSYDLQELDEFQMIRSCIDQHYQHAEIAIDYEWLTLLFYHSIQFQMSLKF